MIFTHIVSAHPCDDNYITEEDRSNCWWRYWNDQSTPADGIQTASAPQPVVVAATPTPPATQPSNTNNPSVICNQHYTEQQDKENCWWRWHNSLPLIAQPTPTSTPVLLPSPTPVLQSSLPTSTPETQPSSPSQYHSKNILGSKVHYVVDKFDPTLIELLMDSRFTDALGLATDCNHIIKQIHPIVNENYSIHVMCNLPINYHLYKALPGYFNLDTANELLDQISPEWHEEGKWRLNSNSRSPIAFDIKLSIDNQDVRPIIPLCQEFYAKLGININYEIHDSVASNTPPVSTSGASICIDWIQGIREAEFERRKIEMENRYMPTPTPAPLMLEPSMVNYRIHASTTIVDEVFTNPEFLLALYYTLDCALINDMFYQGKATHEQACPSYPGAIYNQYGHPHLAGALLDSIGLNERDVAGFLYLPSGEKLSWTIESVNNDHQTNALIAMCKQFFLQVGLDVDHQITSTSSNNDTITATTTGTGVCLDWLLHLKQD